MGPRVAPSWGTPGESAAQGYRSAVRRRRRSRSLRWALVAGAMAAAWIAFRWSHGEGRLVIAGLVALALGCAAVWRPDRDARRWLRGAGGEVATAGLLDRLPAKRWRVFHDLAVPGSRSNIDHLVVGPTGVWVIDSKTTLGSVEVRMFSVRLGDRRLDTGPVRWQAEVVGDRLGVRARPLIAIHFDPGAGGTGLRRRGVRREGVRVVLAADLLRRLRRGRRRFRRGDVEAVAGEVLAHFRPAALSASQNWARD